MPSPSRDLAAGRLDLAQLLDGRRDVLGPVDLRQQPGRVRDEVEPDLVLLLELLDELGLVLEDQPLGDRPAARLPAAGRAGRVGFGGRLAGPASQVASAALVSGFSYWSTICSLAESSIMT